MPNARAVRAGRVFVEVFADNTRLIRGLRAAERRVSEFAAGLRSVGLRAMGLGAAALAPLGATAKIFASYGDELAKSSKRTGVSVEAISELRYAAALSGVEFGGLEGAIRRMQRTIHSASSGLRSASSALAEIGLSVEMISAMSPDQQFEMIAGALAGVSDATTRASLAMQIFGRSGTSVLPIVDRGADGLRAMREDARSLGITMSSDAARSAEQLADSYTRLRSALTATAAKIGASLAPMLINLSSKTAEAISAAAKWIAENSRLIVSFAELSAGLLAVGVVTTGLGYAMSVLSAGIAAVRVGLTIALNPLAAIGLGIAAVAAGMTDLASAGSLVRTSLSAAWSTLASDISASMAGIADAMASGDIELAARIMWRSIIVEWSRATLAMRTKWEELRSWMSGMMDDLALGVKAAWWSMVYGLEIGATELVAGITEIWSRFSGWFARLWVSIKATARKSWNYVTSLFDSGVTDEVLAYQQHMVDLERVKELSLLGQRAEREKTSRADALAKRIAELERERDAELSRSSRSDQRRRTAAEAERRERVAAAERELADAIAERDRIIAEAREKRSAIAAGPELGRTPTAPTAGAPDMTELARAAGGAAGTFVAAFGQLLGLRADPVQERIARGVEDIERNTRALRDVEEIAFT